MKIYLANQSETSYFKIGVTKKPPLDRLLELQTGNPHKLLLIHEFETRYDYILESYLHSFFNNKNKNGEWFELTEDDVNSFIDICNKGEKIFSVLRKAQNPFI